MPESTQAYEYGTDANPEVTADVFKELDELVNRMREEEEAVAKCQEDLKSAQKRLAALSEQAIPELMQTMNTQEWKTLSGYTVTIKTSLRHSLSKERKPAAIAWLREHGHADIIKNLVQVRFGVGEEAEARSLGSALLEEYGGRAEVDEDVHSATLKALLNKLLEKGVDVPLDTFGAFEQKQTQIKS